MKRTYLILLALYLAMQSASAQSPESINYQAVVRGEANAELVNQAIGMQISILQGTADGTLVYEETFNPTTNEFGLVSIEIGSGVEGGLSSIDWSGGPYFLEVAVDAANGSNYSVIGTSQLLSVPFALHATTAERAEIAATAETAVSAQTALSAESAISAQTAVSAETVVNDNVDDADADPANEIQTISRAGSTVTLSNGGGSFQDSVNVYTAGEGVEISNNVISVSSSGGRYVGELYGGEVVMHVDHTGQHGLIMSLEDLSTGTQAGTFTTPNSPWDGKTNTENAVAASATGSGVILCNDYAAGGFTDWYLPARDELRLIIDNLYEINKALDSDGDPLTTTISEGIYHTSSRRVGSGHYYFSFTRNSGYFYNNQGSSSASNRIRAIRQF